MTSRSLLARSVAIFTLCVSHSYAEEDSAALFQKANQAIERKAYRQAAELFEQAHRQAPHPATVFNAAAAWEQAGERPRAADAYETALSMGGLAGEQAAYAQERLTVLKKSLGYLRLTAPIGATASVAHARNVAIPATVHLAPGAHTVVFHMGADVEMRKPLRLLAGETQSVAAERPAPMAQSRRPAARSTPAPKQPAPPAPTQEKDHGAGSAQRTWGWVSVGVAGALAASSAVLTVQTFSAVDNFEASGRTDLEARDRAVKLRTWSNATAVGAVVLGAAGVYVLLTASGDTASGRRTPARHTQRASRSLEHVRF